MTVHTFQMRGGVLKVKAGAVYNAQHVEHIRREMER